MGSQFSKRKDTNASSQLGSHYPSDLTSYADACRLDPDLQTFDATIRERTSRVINTLAQGVEVRSLSLDSLKEVTGCLLEMNQEVAKIILDCKRDIWKNPELFNLVEEYFENSLHTLDFCTELEKCLRRARDSQLIIQIAMQHFQDELEKEPDCNNETRYIRTLVELRNFKDAGDPFTEDFFALFESVSKHQVSMLNKLRVRKRKLDKKLKSVKQWSRVCNIIFASALVSVLICSVVAAAITAPPVLTAVAAALAAPVGSMGKWLNSVWKGYENSVRAQRDIVSSMHMGAFITIKDLDSIRLLVNKLEIAIESISGNVDFALREESFAVKFAIDEIKKKLNVFMETMEDLERHAGKCSHSITTARTVVLQRIIRHPSLS